HTTSKRDWSSDVCSSELDDLILISRKGQSLRFTATDEALRPMGRATAGVRGMKFRKEDKLLTMGVIEDDSYVFTITDGGFAKRKIGRASCRERGEVAGEK